MNAKNVVSIFLELMRVKRQRIHVYVIVFFFVKEKESRDVQSDYCVTENYKTKNKHSSLPEKAKRIFHRVFPPHPTLLCAVCVRIG